MAFTLDASDRVRLDTCALDHDALVDLLTAARYPLTPTAAALLAGCDGTVAVGDLAAEHARAYGVDPAVLLADLDRFVAELTEVGLVRVRRRWRHHLAGAVLGALGALSDATPAPEAAPGAPADAGRPARRRFPPTLAGCGRGALHAAGPVLAFALAWSAVLGVLVARFAPGAPLVTAAVPALVALAGLATVAAHEVGHLAAVRAVRGRARYVAAGRNQVGVIHDVHHAGRRRLVAVAGPAAGVAAGVAAWPLAAVLPAPADDLAAPLALVLALGHLAGLLPWFADGRHLWTGGSR